MKEFNIDRDQLFKEFYLKKNTISEICKKYKITRYRFYKFKNAYPKKSFYDYTLIDWVTACNELSPNGSAQEICNYLNFVNKADYTTREIEEILSTL